jgi:cytochrome c oxidase subunit 2
VGGLAGASLLLSGCSLADLPRFGWPEGHTDEGAAMQYFWSATFIAALVIGIGVWGLMFWSFALHRKKKGSPLYPKQTKENLPLEIVYTAIPMVLVMILFYFTVTTENKVLKMEANPDVTVEVTAFKWNWDFSYQGTVSPDGTADGLVHTVGSSSEIPMLILPTNKVIQYELQSRDVIHSFWVPDFLFKRDVFPSPEANQVDNGDKFQNTITVEGAMVGRCAELCGQYHSMMNFEVRAMPEELYNEYLDLRQAVNPDTGRGYTNAEALTRMDCGELCAPVATTTETFDTRRTADNILAGGN